MFGSADEQVSIMFPTLPPDWEVEAGPAKLEALMQLWTPKHLLTDFPQQFNAVQSFCCPLLSDGFNIDVGIRGTWRERYTELTT